MKKYRNSIQKSPILFTLLFGVVLSMILVLVTYFFYSNSLFKLYRSKISSVLTHVEKNIDADDLRECVRTGQTSEKYALLQQELNTTVDDFELFYLYIVIPRDDVMVNVCSATSEAEREAGEEDMPLLETSDLYEPEVLKLYRDAMEADGFTFFREDSGWGSAYTGVKGLRASDGEVFCELCADIDLASTKQTLRLFSVISLLISFTASAVCLLLLYRWIKRNVTTPVLKLEQSARRFMEDNSNKSNQSLVPFDPPEIHTGNEMESLTESVKNMAQSMDLIMERLLSTREKAASVQLKMEDMTRIALQDALTHVKSKAAYDRKEAELNSRILSGGEPFALVMVDLNCLKGINDSYGHENGDKYIVGSCKIVSDIYKHSPVFRVGGDEFVVVLTGGDFELRDELLQQLRDCFAAAAADLSREPWDRYSASAGMAVFTPGEDKNADDVLRRADKAMYTRKKELRG